MCVGSLALGHLCFWAYAATSLTGYLCKRNLGPAGAFLAVATWGLLIALLSNIFFLQRENFHLILSLVVILVFAGLTACDTQAIADAFDQTEDDEEVERFAIFGAFLLYGNFAVLFSWIMNLLGEES